MKRILILASNPKRDLALDQEIRDLEGVVKRAKNRDDLEVRVGSAVRPEDLQELLLDCDPQIVHFCGHGTGQQGLVLESAAGRERLVSTSALSSLFELFSSKVECVLLNACYSEVQAAAICQHINYVVGMSQAIRDDAAIAFATGFYRALGYARSIEEAYRFGCNAIQLVIPTTILSQSPTAAQTRRLQPVSLSQAEQVIIPEHLKPVLKRRQTLNARLDQFAAPTTQPTKQPVAEQVEIQCEVQKALEQEGALKQYRDRVRAFLADRVLTPVEEYQLKKLAQELQLSEIETTAILEDEKNKIRQTQEDYRQILIRYVQQGAYPFSQQTLTELQLLQQELDLSDAEVNEISKPIVEALVDQQQATKAVASPTRTPTEPHSTAPQAVYAAATPTAPTKKTKTLALIGIPIVGALLLALGYLTRLPEPVSSETPASLPPQPENSPPVDSTPPAVEEPPAEQPPEQPTEQPPEQPTAAEWENQGLEKFYNGDYQGAITAFTEAIALRPNASQPYYRRGLANYYTGQYDAAVQDYTEAINQNQNWGALGQGYFGIATAYYYRGYVRFSLKQYQEALPDFDAAIAAKPDYAEPLHARGAVYAQLGSIQNAIADYQQAIDLYAKQGNAQGQQKASSDLARIEPTEQPPEQPQSPPTAAQ